MPKEEGYEYGIEPGKKLFEEGFKLGIQEVSTYIFTQENTHRSKEQIDAYQKAFLKFIDWIKEKKVSILVIGDTESRFFSAKLRRYSIPEKDRGERMKLNFLVNYSWKWDLTMILENCQNERINRRDIQRNIGSKDVSRIDLIIRWGKRRRLSGFLPIQSAYADIYVVDKLWPDFEVGQFHEALKWYEKQDITLGG